jgi:hypothetical protein
MAKRSVKGPITRPAGRFRPSNGKKKAKPAANGREVMQFPEAIPAEMAGKYVVWSPDGLRIVGSASTVTEALAIADLEDGRLIQRVPKAIRAHSLSRTVSVDGEAADAMSHSSRGKPANDPKSADIASRPDLFNWRDFDPAMLPGGLDTPLAVELVTYRDRLDEMLAEHEGDFVVIRGDRIAGFHASRKEALEAAFKEFGREPALIKQVVEKEPVRRIRGVVG